MEIPSHHLEQTLRDQQLSPLYYVAGTDVLLVQESGQSIVSKAREHGFDEVVQMEVATKDDWDLALLEAESPSLFAEKRLFELSMKVDSIDRSSSAAIKSYLENPHPDALLLVRGRTFQFRHRSAAWFRLFSKEGVVVVCEPLSASQLTQWISNRAREKRLRLTEDAIEEIADLTEGNLLASHQEIERLHLAFLGSEEEISSDNLNMQNWSTTSAFELIDAACFGDTNKMSKSLMSLSREGTEPLTLIGLIAAQLRRMHSLAIGERLNMSQRRLRPLQAAYRRIGLESIKRLMMECTNIDSQRKGVLSGDAWNSVCSLLIGIAGSREVPTIEPRVRSYTIDYDA